MIAFVAVHMHVRDVYTSSGWEKLVNIISRITASMDINNIMPSGFGASRSASDQCDSLIMCGDREFPLALDHKSWPGCLWPQPRLTESRSRELCWIRHDARVNYFACKLQAKRDPLRWPTSTQRTNFRVALPCPFQCQRTEMLWQYFENKSQFRTRHPFWSHCLSEVLLFDWKAQEKRSQEVTWLLMTTAATNGI
jgi:hypothetical protein